ncbi:ABC transporter permease [Paenibacillus sp. FJAT-26967]|uniref:ABC transporter permease n=1 Tax=Paenibacillus sp. FJAT-26967 TaxID=1729690 RepID=UPI0008399CB2|nr:ABC transporter permease [Paenibacillus sp. FJAT-26967]
MLKLMKLELKKHKFGRYWYPAAIANAVILALIGFMLVVQRTEQDLDFMKSYSGVFDTAGTMVKATFIIFASVLLARLVIGEYKNRTITLMYTYPIKRKKVLTAKLLTVSLWTFMMIILSHVVVIGVFLAADAIIGIVNEPLSGDLIRDLAVSVLFKAVTASGICLIPLLLGMKKQSTPATIISAVILVSITDSNNGGYSLNAFILAPVLLAIAGIVTAYFCIRNVEKADVL